MADSEFQSANVHNDKTSVGANEEETPPNNHAAETSLLELKEMLVNIQITVSNVLRENIKLANEVAELRREFNPNQRPNHLGQDTETTRCFGNSASRSEEDN